MIGIRVANCKIFEDIGAGASIHVLPVDKHGLARGPVHINICESAVV